ncbi:methylamine utilization protein [Methylibium sp.]|uniref:methylamine utilization protein n=1 Tax=Methylibium sp. TaxID=2067992 RepID=UPI00260116B2|nr:methylamine utilization protein [Methylibium sp.]
MSTSIAARRAGAQRFPGARERADTQAGRGMARQARRLAVCLTFGASALASLPAAATTLTITVTGAGGAPLADAVVAVFVDGAPRRASGVPPVEMGQRGKRFVPAVLAVQTGTPVDFPNHDTVRHHVYSFSPIKTFEIKLYVGTPTQPVVFDKPGTAVLGCNIHDAMSAFIRVVDTPYFARTDLQGQARLELPPGKHRVQVWHPGLPAETDAPLQPLEVGGADASVTLGIEPR